MTEAIEAIINKKNQPVCRKNPPRTIKDKPKTPRKYMLKEIPRLYLILSGLALLLLICSIPVTSVDEVINTSFTVESGAKYGPYDTGTYYHTRVLAKSVLKGEVIVEGKGIYLTVRGYNTQHLKPLYVKGQYSFMIDPANDQYTLIFDNTEGDSNCLVKFTLEEIWTRPMALDSPPLFITGLIGFFLFLAGLVTLAITRLYKQNEKWHLT